MATLRQFSSCEISDALIKLGISHGGHIPDIHQYSPNNSETCICGPAFTVQMVKADDKDSPKPSQHFVDAAPAGSVMVINAPAAVKSAVWGGLMTIGAQAQGVIGVVISGRCRDLSEHKAARFPVFARGHSTLGQSTFTRPSALNVPVRIESIPPGNLNAVTVEPGDIILADEDGVVCVPQLLIEKVVQICIKSRDIDSQCHEDIKSGKGVQESFTKWRGKL